MRRTSRELLAQPPLHLFEGVGIELEYMIVRRDTLDVLPVSDKILRAAAGKTVMEYEARHTCWSNELVLHVLELKTRGPARTPAGWAPVFGTQIRRINRLLGPLGGRLMPSAAHPWMDPDTQTRLWPHDNSAIYNTFDRIFDCRGHGWANLQSVHLNLPFQGDDEFVRLHSAIRVLMPLLPALAASSPFQDGHRTGLMDSRLETYRHNCRKIPSISGQVIPEPVGSIQEYHARILRRIYRDLAPHDPDGVLRDEWVNARGAIARFERNTIEIRVLDVQECPAADLALAGLIIAVLRALAEERWAPLARLARRPVPPLFKLLRRTIRDAGDAVIDDRDYLALLGIRGPKPLTAAAVWRRLATQLLPADDPAWPALEVILNQGALARRIALAVGEPVSRDRLRAVYSRLCDCLARGRMFEVE